MLDGITTPLMLVLKKLDNILSLLSSCLTWTCYLHASPISKTGSYHYSAIMSLGFTCRGFPPLCC